ncbi:MAG: EI24 domain-containing protein [Proteobacteria bacterium]|nr:EI24 domain-containing protein [Pseudomonadota bacterium]
MFASVGKALGIFSDRAFLGVVLKALALTALLFAVLFVGLRYGLAHLPTLEWHWVNVLLDWFAQFALLFLLFFLGAPVAAIFASLFLDEIAQAVERKDYPEDPPAPGTRFSTALYVGLRLALWIVLLNILLLPVNLFPGIGTVVSLLVNGWLLGREFFELVAMRHMTLAEADAMRRRYGAGVLWAGVLIAILTLIPFVNLLAPLFGAAFMVHVFKRYAHEDRAR